VKAGVDKIDFLKLDCEGAEHDILANCPSQLLMSISYIALEVHSSSKKEHNVRYVKEKLLSLGFNVATAECEQENVHLGRDHPFIWAWR